MDYSARPGPGEVEKNKDVQQEEFQTFDIGDVEQPKVNRIKDFFDSFKPGIIQAPDIDPKTGLVIVKEDSTVVRHAGEIDENGGLMRRKLQSRHIQMIGIGGSIGVGLFVGSGKALQNGGPAPIIISFIITGIMLFCTINSLAELAVAFPVQGSFNVYASRFIDPAWGFAMGWNFSVHWLITFPLELVAAGMVMRYWNTGINLGVFITIFFMVLIIINIFGVRGFGEAEFVFCSVKILAVVGFMILGMIIVCGGVPGTPYLGTHTWHNPGAFANGFKGFCSTFVMAAYAFSGTEHVGLTASEAENPRKSLPHVTKTIVWRIMLFYLVNLFLIGLIVPYTNKNLIGADGNDTTASPFVIAINIARIKVLPDIFNAVIIVAVLSVANSAIYSSSRTLAALAGMKQAPSIFKYIDRRGRPLVGVLCGFAVGCLAYAQLAPKGSQMFDWLSALSGLAALFTWLSINLSYIRFHHAMTKQGVSRNELAFHSAVGVRGAYVGAAIAFLSLVAQFYVSLSPIKKKPSVEAFFKGYISGPIVLFFFVLWKVLHRRDQPAPTLSTIDLHSGRRIFDRELLKQMEMEERRKKTFVRRLLDFVL